MDVYGLHRRKNCDLASRDGDPAGEPRPARQQNASEHADGRQQRMRVTRPHRRLAPDPHRPTTMASARPQALRCSSRQRGVASSAELRSFLSSFPHPLFVERVSVGPTPGSALV
jgi:hypothetical protein